MQHLYGDVNATDVSFQILQTVTLKTGVFCHVMRGVFWWMCAHVSEDPTTPIISFIDGERRIVKCRLTYTTLHCVYV